MMTQRNLGGSAGSAILGSCLSVLQLACLSMLSLITHLYIFTI